MIERRILIGLITSTEFNERMSNKWSVQLLESATAKRLATWVIEYFKKYNKAPGKDLEGIFYQKMKNGLPKDLAEEIEQDILPELSEESIENPINVDYLVDEAITYFNERHLLRYHEEGSALVKNGNLSEAEKHALSFKPVTTDTDKLSKFIWSLEDMQKLKVKKPLLLMKPWLRAGQTTFIYGDYGTGKSMLAVHIASLLALDVGTASDYDIEEWQVKKSTGCLYIDGEMGVVDLQDRLTQFQYLGEPKFPVLGFPVPEYQLATEDDFSLFRRENQLQVVEWLKQHTDYKLLILDSVTTLFGLTDENSNAEWNTKINPFLRDLRALGVANIILHHSGKDGRKGLRGASAMGAMAHNIFYLENHNAKDIDKGQAWFTINKKKQRGGGFQFKTFSIHYIQNEDGTETEWTTNTVRKVKEYGISGSEKH